MKVAISSTGPDLEAEVDPRFGRCQYFVIVDPETKEFEVLDNQAAMTRGGAGIQAAQMMANSGVDAVITGHLGPKAAETLVAAALKTYLGASGSVGEALQQYIDGQLKEASGPTVESHFGTGGMGGGTGAGRGMGRGRGGGRGRGMKMDRGMGDSRDMEKQRGRRK